MTVWCRYHCRDCGAHLASLEAFDAHHEGSGASLVPCAWPPLPDGSAWVERTGTCRISDPTEPQVGVTVYALTRPGKFAARGEDGDGVACRESAEGGARAALAGAVA